MLQSLQAGRALAALMVLGFHLGLAVKAYFGVEVFLLPWGHAGVDFFFVLSGFIVTRVHAGDVDEPARLGRFLHRRFVRIYPIYWVVFLAAYAGAYRIVKLTPLEVVKALSLVPADTAPVISVAWSLQWEVVFYLLFGAFILSRWLGLAAVAAVLAWLPGSAIYLLLFAGGVLCALIDRRGLALRGPLLACAGALVFAGACVFDTVTGLKPTPVLGVGSCLLLLGLVASERQGRVFGAHPLLQLLGDASYAIYLVHYPLISAGCKLAMVLGLQGPVWGAVLYPVLLIAAVGAGVGLHRRVEKPLVARLNRR